jgi:hypothetical protein
VDGEGTAKKLLEDKPGGRLKIGRPRLRLMDDVESDHRSIGIKRRINALGRTEWSYVIRETRDKLEEP